MQLLDAMNAMPGLVACWTFDEPAGSPRVNRFGRRAFALREIGGPVRRTDDAPVGGHAVRFDTATHLQLDPPHLHELDIHGRDARLSIFAVVRIDPDDRRGGTVAGVWNEGRGSGDDSGSRQYALLLDMPHYGGRKQVTPHVSAEGGPSYRADGSHLEWNADYAATPDRYPLDRWCSVGMTYDSDYVHAFLDGVARPRALDPAADRRTDRYFTHEGPHGRDRGLNPYYQGRGIFHYDPARHASTKPNGPSPFVVGAREVNGKPGSEPLAGQLAALAVFDDCLTHAQMLNLHRMALPG